MLVILPCLQRLYENPDVHITLIASPSWSVVARGMCNRFLSCEDTGLLPLFSGSLDMRKKPAWVPDTGFDKTFLFLVNEDIDLRSNFLQISSEVYRVQSRPGTSENFQKDLPNIRDFLFSGMFPEVTGGARPRACWPLTQLSQDPIEAGLRDPTAGLGTLPGIVFHAGSGSPEKNWPLENYLQMADICIDGGRPVFWTLGPADDGLKQKLLSHSSHPLRIHNDARSVEVWNAKPEIGANDEMHLLELTLDDLVVVLGRFNCLVGNDSGITHLAAAMGLDVITIFGASNPALWTPEGPHGYSRFLGKEQEFPDLNAVEKVLSVVLNR